MTEECIFCKVVKGEIPSHKVFEDNSVLAFLDINPINEGHTLVIPKKHASNLLEMDEELLSQVMIVTQKIAKAVKEAVKADGVNLGVNIGKAAGQIIFHAHIHVIPRFENDGLKHWTRAHETIPNFKEVADKIRAQLKNK